MDSDWYTATKCLLKHAPQRESKERLLQEERARNAARPSDASEARARTRETTLSDIVGYITVSRVRPLVQSSRVAHAIIYNYTSPRH